MFGVFSKTETARMITVLLLFFCIFLGWQKLAMADHHYLESDWQYWEGRKIEITTVEYQADGNLEIKIAWKASTGAPFPSLDCFDKAFSLSFSGMHAVSLLDSEGGGSSSGEWGYSSYKYRCNNTESSLYQDCSVIIDAKYLQPGNLIISSYFNGTSGMHTVVIPENEEPSAPVVFPEKTEFLLGEKLTLFGEIAQENAAIEWFAICTDHEGNVSSRYVTAQSNPKIGIVTETFSDLPINAVDGQSKFTYRLRYRDKETGVWSAFSEPVTITVKRIGTIPMPEIEFPESIPVDGAGTDITISNPMEGVQYSIFRSGFGDGACFIDSIEEYTWHLSPYAVGITSFQIEATALGYQNVYTYYNMTITEGNGGQPEAPEVDIINYENGTSMTFQVIAPGMTEVYINPSSLKKRYLLGCGEQITIDFRSYYIASAEFRVKIDGKWSKETRLNFMLIDSSKLQKPSVHVYTDENGYVPSGEDIYILIKNTKNASKYQIYSYTSFFSSGNLMNSDIYRATIDATGGDIITFIPKFYQSACEEDRIHFIEEIERKLSEMEKGEKLQWWNKWLKDFLENRMNNIPEKLSEKERTAIFNWLPNFDDEFDDTVNIFCNYDFPCEVDPAFFFTMEDNNRAQTHPESTIALIIKLLNSSSHFYFGEHYLESIIAKAIDKIGKDQKRKLQEGLLRRNIDLQISGDILC